MDKKIDKPTTVMESDKQISEIPFKDIISPQEDKNDFKCFQETSSPINPFKKGKKEKKDLFHRKGKSMTIRRKTFKINQNGGESLTRTSSKFSEKIKNFSKPKLP